jgi:hypothetical protein
MSLDELIITVFCRVDEAVKQVMNELEVTRLRRSGPRPKLSDSEALTLEVVGAFLKLSEDQQIYAYFRRHYGHFFPALLQIHRTTFVRQAANLWKLKERVWQALLEQEAQPSYVIVDSLPLPVCRFARAPYSERFRGEAAFGYDWVARQTFYGFRLHALVDPNGLIQSVCLAPAEEAEGDALEEMTQEKVGRVLGDRNYWMPERQRRLLQRGIKVVAPYKHKTKDPNPDWSRALSPMRYRIETVFGQLTDRYRVKQVWAKQRWQLISRLLRCVLSHTLMFLINRSLGRSPLQLAQLLDF